MKSAELNFWRKCITRETVMDRMRTEDIRTAVRRNTTIMDRIEEKRLTWYGMKSHSLPRKILQWNPRRRKKRGRPDRTWIDGVRAAITYRDLTVEDWQDRNL
ncbi:hypothetical protein ANN_14482 [Periplaneta americana]|uniref:Uncharacterized protein n=1 Tax=Periplaneta americana TaxID=6978 RepID=A0ABQ8SWF9_PERAM|nr:hypothetical protein ANN_14482 [Periplaneta americana]